LVEKGEGEETNLSYTFRLSTAKLLLDLEDFDTATKVRLPFIGCPPKSKPVSYWLSAKSTSKALSRRLLPN
jgi:hypothetical protein